MNKLPTEYQENREAALNQNQPRYAGRPCTKGHSGERWTKGGSCVRCSLDYQLTRSKTPEVQAKAKAYYQNNLPRKLWMGAKHRATKNGREFSIEEHDIVIPEFCPVLGIPMTSPSLDRFDNSKGYTKENVRVISYEANVIKGVASIETLEKVLDYMRGKS